MVHMLPLRVEMSNCWLAWTCLAPTVWAQGQHESRHCEGLEPLWNEPRISSKNACRSFTMSMPENILEIAAIVLCKYPQCREAACHCGSSKSGSPSTGNVGAGSVTRTDSNPPYNRLRNCLSNPKSH